MVWLLSPDRTKGKGMKCSSVGPGAERLDRAEGRGESGESGGGTVEDKPSWRARDLS